MRSSTDKPTASIPSSIVKSTLSDGQAWHIYVTGTVSVLDLGLFLFFVYNQRSSQTSKKRASQGTTATDKTTEKKHYALDVTI